VAQLKKRQEIIFALQKHPEFIKKANHTFRELEPYEKTVLDYKPNDTSKVSEGQIFFQGESTKTLNLIPYCIAFFVFLKVWIAPALGLLIPAVLSIMPYVIMTQIMDMHITWDMYQTLMKQMVLGIQSGESWKPKHYGQALWTLVSLGQGIVQPFFTAYNTYRLDAEIQKRGSAFIKLYSALREILDESKSYSSRAAI
jgi:hypothetical protein